MSQKDALFRNFMGSRTWTVYRSMKGFTSLPSRVLFLRRDHRQIPLKEGHLQWLHLLYSVSLYVVLTFNYFLVHKGKILLNYNKGMRLMFLKIFYFTFCLFEYKSIRQRFSEKELRESGKWHYVTL